MPKVTVRMPNKAAVSAEMKIRNFMQECTALSIL